jgi:hypothetical protein
MGATNRAMGTPDETVTYDLGQVQRVKIGGSTIRRNTYQPGWRWSTNAGPIAQTDTCQDHHVGYVISGRLHVATNDGAEVEVGPGEAYEIQPGHDGWVVGDETLIAIEFSSAGTDVR